MKRYTKPEIRFLITRITENIAANCWGTVSPNDSLLVTDGAKSFIFHENTATPYPTGDWGGECVGKIPSLLREAISKEFGVQNNSLNSFNENAAGGTGTAQNLVLIGTAGS